MAKKTTKKKNHEENDQEDDEEGVQPQVVRVELSQGRC